MPAIRLTDVAHDAGVSLATASRVLNGSSRVPGKQVTEKVQRSAARLGYVANAQAQGLARTHSGLIGLVVHDISDPYFAVMARRIQSQLFASNSQVLLTQTNRDVDTETRAIRSLIAQRADAIILVGTYSYGTAADEEISALLTGFDMNGGIVLGIGRGAGVGGTIALDDAASAHDLATALVVEGHRRFAVVGGMSPIPAAANRTGGFLAGLTEAGVEAELSVDATLDREGGHHLAQRVAEHLRATGEGASGGDGSAGSGVGDGPLLVFSPADVMALGALGELRRQGLGVPRDVAVAGFGGVPASADSNPTLTTLSLPLQEIAEQAVTWVLEMTGGGSADGTARAEHGADGDDAASGMIVRSVRGEVQLRESTRLPEA